MKNFLLWLLINSVVAAVLGGVGWLVATVFKWDSFNGVLVSLIGVVGFFLWLGLESDGDGFFTMLFLGLGFAALLAIGWAAFHYLHWIGLIATVLFMSFGISRFVDLTEDDKKKTQTDPKTDPVVKSVARHQRKQAKKG